MGVIQNSYTEYAVNSQAQVMFTLLPPLLGIQLKEKITVKFSSFSQTPLHCQVLLKSSFQSCWAARVNESPDSDKMMKTAETGRPLVYCLVLWLEAVQP